MGFHLLAFALINFRCFHEWKPATGSI